MDQPEGLPLPPSLAPPAGAPPETTVGPETHSGGGAARPGAGAPPVDSIGKYRVVERLGAGGQGEVFRAAHPALGRDVVIKWAAAHLPAELRDRPLDEGRVLARLDDPGVVRVHDVGVAGGRPFVVLEYVRGHSLAERLRRRPFTPAEAAALVAELASVLDRVHRRGVLHRDLKPGNVLIDDAGRPLLLDFGLASLSRGWEQVGPAGDGVCGTPAYMAPEQAEGRADLLGPRTDVFGLGAVLYEMLAGRPPHAGRGGEVSWQQVRTASFPPPRRLRPGVPRALEAVCLKAMARDPADRHATAGEMARALRRAARRRWPLATAGALAVAAALLGAWAAAWAWPGGAWPAGGVSSSPAPAAPPPAAGAGPAPGPAAAPRRPPPGWREYASRPGRYRVWPPSAPTERRQGPQTDRGPTYSYLAISERADRQLSFCVSYSDPQKRLFPDPQLALETMKKGSLGSFEGEVRKESPLRLGPHHGLEVLATARAQPGAPPLWMRLRTYLVGDLAYILMAMGTRETVQGEGAGTFFGSFELRPSGAVP